MPKKSQSPLAAALLTLLAAPCLLAAAPAPAAAQSDALPEANLEFALEFGAMDRGTTGVGAPLLGYGYDHGGGALGALSTRLLFRFGYGDYFRHGLDTRVGYSAGEFFGIDGAAFHIGQLDLGYVFRTEFPCMRSDDRRIHLSGAIGVTGMYADAGTGRGEADDMWNARVRASEELDHFGVGGYVAVDLAAHFGAAMVGVRLDAREYFAAGHSTLARDVNLAASLRFGVDIGL